MSRPGTGSKAKEESAKSVRNAVHVVACRELQDTLPSRVGCRPIIDIPMRKRHLFGAGLVVLGISLVFTAAGTLDLTVMRISETMDPLILAAAALFVIGFGVKTALVPPSDAPGEQAAGRESPRRDDTADHP